MQAIELARYLEEDVDPIVIELLPTTRKSVDTLAEILALLD